MSWSGFAAHRSLFSLKDCRLSSWRYPSPIFYYAILHCYNSWQQTTVDTSCRYYQSWYSKRSIIWTTLVTTKCILLSTHQKNDSSCCIERPTPIVKAMRYLTHIYAIPLNDYILLKYPIVFIHLPWSRYSRIDDIRYLTHLSIICGGEEQLYMEEYWHNNRDFIVQSTRGIYQWILLNI